MLKGKQTFFNNPAQTLDAAFNQLSPKSQEEFEHIINKNWSTLTPEEKYHGLQAFYEIKNEERKETKRDMQQALQLNALTQFYQGMQEISQQLAHAIKYTGDKVETLTNTLTQYVQKAISSVAEKSFTEKEETHFIQAPPQTAPRFGACIYQHPEIKTPIDCIATFQDQKGTHQLCTIAYYAYDRTWTGIQWFASGKGGPLARSGCPLYNSRDLIERLFPHDRCRLADGKCHSLKYLPGTNKTFPLIGPSSD